MPVAEPPVVLFDGVCNLCAGAVQYILERERTPELRFASLQSSQARALLEPLGALDEAAELDTVMLLERGRLFSRSTAALRLAHYLRWPWSLLRIFWIVPRPLRDAAYGFVARRRYRWFGKRESCWLPTPALRARFLDIT